MYQNKGFTLIEVMVLVVIIAILAALAIPKFRAASERAKHKNESTQIVVVNGRVSTEPSIDNNKLMVNMDKVLKLGAEYGYYCGQKDAINGMLRIKPDCSNTIYSFEKCSTYVWTKSPWDSLPGIPFTNRPAIYNPKLSLQENFNQLK